MREPEKQIEPERSTKAGAEPKGFEHVTAEDFAAAACEAPISASRKVYVLCHGTLYEQAQKDAEGAGDAIASKVYRLLSAVTQMHFKPNDRAEPYGPMFVMEGRRSVIPSDLRGPQSEVLAAIARGIVNPGLRARLADIAWLNDRKQAAMAQLAISSYCAAVQDVIDGKAELFFEDAKATSHNGAELLRRACQLTNMTGWKEPDASTLKNLIASLSESAFNDPDAPGFLNIGELDADYRITEPQIMAERAETLALSAELDPDTVRHVWELAARAHRQSGKDSESNRCMTSAAECYVRMAEVAGLPT